MGRLGCLEDLEVFITNQCSAPRLCDLEVSAVTFNRVLDDISEAEVTVVKSDASPNCCRCIAQIEPFCHMLHIIRNGETVWQGPVIETTETFEKFSVFAKDVLAWTQYRVPIVPLDNTKKFPNGQEITDIALEILEGNFAEHDPCVLSEIIQTDLLPTSIRPTRYAHTKVSPENGFPASEGYYFDWLHNLGEIGLDYTVIGTRVLLGIENFNIQRIGTLTDEHIMGDIEVKRKGSLMANRVYTHFQDDDQDATCLANNPITTTAPCPAVSEAVGNFAPDNKANCYGPIERILAEGVPFDYNTAKQAGDTYVDAGKYAPRTITFPQGAKLSPDTPFEFNELIPGQRIDVALTGLCQEVFSPFRVLEVTYTIEEGGDEEIALTLGPLNALSTQ